MNSAKCTYAGCWHGFTNGPIGSVTKVKAHSSLVEAEAGDWVKDWTGNNVADELAKGALAHVTGQADQWIKYERARAEKLDTALAHLPDDILTKMATTPLAPKNVRLARRQGTSWGHLFTFVAGRWACSECGKASNAGPSGRQLGQADVCKRRLTVISKAHPSHSLAVGEAQPGCGGQRAHGLPFAICTACGHYSSSKLVGLAKQCPRTSRGRKIALDRVTRGLHPIRSARANIIGLRPAAPSTGYPVAGTDPVHPAVPPCLGSTRAPTVPADGGGDNAAGNNAVPGTQHGVYPEWHDDAALEEHEVGPFWSGFEGL